ncbi:MAG TPA: acetyl-CoA carboxylase biotin carboxyl carrier protein [Acidobacteriaceae bacterium]|jgi:acetyl-CoA carboxylase biotin carboxyl carrier protein|nr:acetyl-CoA carboxylase biotin carboxyl carrier protein [Acidobacteriaceae bacterium]
MNAEDMNELKELIEFLKENKIGEFDLERGDLKVRIKFAQEGGADLAGLTRLLQAQAAAAPAANLVPASGTAPAVHASASAAEAPAAEDTDAGLHIVKSPIVGTFYESPSPGSPAFVKIGDQVEVGQVLCIVEAMKLMNEIESDGAGEIVKRFVQSGQPVEYGQQLFAVRPR